MLGSYDPKFAADALARLTESAISPHEKGFAGLRMPVTPAQLVGRGASIDDDAFSTPSLVLRAEAIRHNIAVLADYCESLGVLLAPHAKTTMSPELFVAQLEAGAWALTAANVTQAMVFVEAGARRVFVANEVTDPISIDALARLLDRTPGLEVFCYVDSVKSVELLRPLADRALRVMLEFGIPGGRTGVRSDDEAVAVARAANAASLRVAGLSFFEGPLGHRPDVLEALTDLCTQVRATARHLSELGLLDGGGLLLSAGGSHYFDVVAAELARDALPRTRVVVRSGSYVVHDHGTYLNDSPALRGAKLAAFRPAIEVHTTVLSRPERDLVLVGAGRRDVSFDSGLPVVLSASRSHDAIDTSGVTIIDLNDQHGFLRVPESSELSVGDTVVLGISHPCTTFDKWRLALLADDDGLVTGVAHTFF